MSQYILRRRNSAVMCVDISIGRKWQEKKTQAPKPTGYTSGEHNRRTKLPNRLNAVLQRHDSSATKTWFWHGKGTERCERWFWIRSIWVGRGRGVERGKKWFSGKGGVGDEERLVEGRIKREWMKASRKQERRGDKTSTLQLHVVISCQVLTHSSRFCWSKLPCVFRCCLLFSPFFDIYSHLFLCSLLSLHCGFHPHISLSEISSFTLQFASQVAWSCRDKVLLLTVSHLESCVFCFFLWFSKWFMMEKYFTRYRKLVVLRSVFTVCTSGTTEMWSILFLLRCKIQKAVTIPTCCGVKTFTFSSFSTRSSHK